jgi:hypothetical protein
VKLFFLNLVGDFFVIELGMINEEIILEKKES